MFKLSTVSCKITLGSALRDNYYPSRLELQLGDSAPETKTILLEVRRTKNGKVSEKSYELYDEFMKKVGGYSSEYFRRIMVSQAESDPRSINSK